jgi:Domain of unknown function (DUF4190)/Septum formation
MSYPPGADGPPPYQPQPGQYPPPSFPPPSYPSPYPAQSYPQSYPYAQQYPYAQPPPQAQTTSGFAIASLVLGILGAVLLSVIFGIIALGKTKPGGQRGRGMAIAGLALSGVWVVVVVFGVILAVVSPNNTVSALDAKVGECLADVPTGTRVSSLNTTGCEQPHAAEIVAVLTMPDGPFPAEAVLKDYKDKCRDSLSSYSSTAMQDPNVDLAVMPPSEESWRHGDRAMVCIATFTTKRTGSIKG